MFDPSNELDVRFVDAMDRIGNELKLLGNAGAITAEGTEVGAIEGLAMQVRDGLSRLSGAIEELAASSDRATNEAFR